MKPEINERILTKKAVPRCNLPRHWEGYIVGVGERVRGGWKIAVTEKEGDFFAEDIWILYPSEYSIVWSIEEICAIGDPIDCNKMRRMKARRN